MRHVSVAELKANAEELVAAAEAGEVIAIVRDGRDVAQITVAARAASVIDDRTPEQKEQQRRAVDALYELGQSIKARHGITTAAEIREWIDEGRA